jgi:hypothetical protein
MPDSSHPKRLTRPRRTRPLAVATLLSAVLVTGCGGSSTSPTASTVGGAPTSTSTAASTGAATTGGSSTATGGVAASSSSTGPAAGGSGALAFATCMRANGVPNFPDPTPGHGLLFSPAGIDLAAPAVKAAQAKCHKLLRNGGPPGPGTQTHASTQTLAKLLKIARCMRRHGISEFPDPRTSVPSNVSPAEYSDITDFDGAILLFPVTINLQAPAYKQALAACGAPPLGLPH